MVVIGSLLIMRRRASAPPDAETVAADVAAPPATSPPEIETAPEPSPVTVVATRTESAADVTLVNAAPKPSAVDVTLIHRAIAPTLEETDAAAPEPVEAEEAPKPPVEEAMPAPAAEALAEVAPEPSETVPALEPAAPTEASPESAEAAMSLPEPAAPVEAMSLAPAEPPPALEALAAPEVPSSPAAPAVEPEAIAVESEAAPAPPLPVETEPPMSEAERIVSETRAWMQAHADPARAEGAQRYFKEGIALYGLPSGANRKWAGAAYKAIKKAGGLPLALEIGELLYASGNMEEATFAEELIGRFHRQFDRAAFECFDRWIDYVNNWASCDGLGTHLLGPYFVAHRPVQRQLLAWAKSENRWRKRAATVSLVKPVRLGLHLPTAFKVTSALLPVRDDMVEKGVGWLLKEATATPAGARQVVDYLVRNRRKASRLTLRYACEKLPASKKKRILG